MRDPYHTLGVPRSASQDEIKRAYRRLVKELHPDLNPGDEVIEHRFKEVSAAYDLLSDRDKRARFDRGELDAEGRPRSDFAFRRAYADAARRGGRGRGGAAGMGGGTGGGFGGGMGGFNAQDMFSDLFGRGSVRTKGADISYGLTIAFPEAMLGTKKRLTLSDGRDLEITVPPGTDDGQTLRLKAQGTQGFGGGPPGDAFIEISVTPHAFFSRAGRDIHVEVPVTLREAVLGAVIEVPTLEGRVAVKVPPGANTGTSLRLKGKGVPGSGPTVPRGDQYAKLKVVLPDPPDGELKAFVERWQPKPSPDPRKKAGLL